MKRKIPVAVLCAAALLLETCARQPAPEAFVPSGTTILAGAELDRLRASPVYPHLPESAKALLQPFAEARSVLFAADGGSLLAILQGPFHTPPSGATMATPGIALAGPAEAIHAALAQQKSGVSGATALLARAQPLRGANEIWVVMRGGNALPLTGNYANLNRLLRNTQFTTLTMRLTDPVALAATAETGNDAAASEIEQTLRAMITLSAAAAPRDASLLHSIRIQRQGGSVHATASVPVSALGSLF